MPISLDRAGSFPAEGERQLPRIEARAVIHVDEVDAGGFDLDQRLTRTRIRDRHVLHLEHLGTAEPMNANRLHESSRP